ncbi:hypothetical protein H9L10_09190 [Phycicoccus endophyticus]|uniref:TOMM leader peptide-binding protein n=1 Tax=Phycicoccus endophyticus TaxID=1690220 RepID=A0A7G9QYT2_9MICO|nr:hypothetical protein [Phycicoccus endophyticus]NHI20453.1 hypothetical protein [Phycicoccus endophyticus]QNN48507.1 hypothetical protein H9L10_09190 [Phycicoccus endophyticus]GGL30626.1 hypothetical protein GCM10012283_11260 [Phycicoccus endophyticus]
MDAVGQVVVDGWGRVAEETTAQLRRCRVPVRAGAHAADAAELDVAAGGPAPALVLLAVEDLEPEWLRAPSLGAPWQVRGVPLLPVTGRGGVLVVGPLVVPGRTACLTCVRASVPAPGPGPVPTAAVVLGAAVATVTALAVLAGDLALGGISTELGAGGGDVVHRVWTSWPGCRCTSATMAG